MSLNLDNYFCSKTTTHFNKVMNVLKIVVPGEISVN